MRESEMPSVYEVRVHGVASARLVESLCAGLDVKADTVLHGVIEDQAALHGLLARISDIGLEIVNVQQLSPRAAPPRSG
jgi:hypothetical protein